MKTPEQLRADFWATDAKTGGKIRSQYEEIKEVIAQKDWKWIQSSLQAIKLHAIQQTDFYKHYALDDVFPVVNKLILTNNKEACTAKSGYLLPIHISASSGSTGTPFSVGQDLKKRKRTIADLKVLGEWCNYPSHECMVYFRALTEKTRRTPEQEAEENIYYIDCSDLSEPNLRKMCESILEKQPRIIFSYASTLVELAKYIQTVKIQPEQFDLTTVLVSGEGISEENRNLLECVFGTKTYRRYANMEMGILGQDMGDGGAYHLNWGSFYFECLKMDRDEPAEAGEVGRIVITDLFNYAFPMIRYDTGDLGIMEYPDGELPQFKEIFGRSRDCVYSTSGGLLSPAKISVSMWGAEGIKQWQFIQNTQKEYVMKLNADQEVDIQKIRCRLCDVLGHDAKIEFQYVDEIPLLSSNKRRAVVCNYRM